MTYLEAIRRIRRTQDYVRTRVEVRTKEERPVGQQIADIDAFDLACEALQYCHDLQEYESSQQKQS